MDPPSTHKPDDIAFHALQPSSALLESTWNPSIILHHLACVPAKADIDSLQRLLVRTKKYETELSFSFPRNYIHTIIARARTLRVLPRLVEEIHRRYAMLTAASTLPHYSPTSANDKTPLLHKARPSTRLPAERHPASTVIEQAAREWTESEINYKLRKVSTLSHQEVQHLSTEVINQTVAIWLKQHRKIQFFKEQQIRTCSLALLHILKINILDRLQELTEMKQGSAAFELISLSSDQDLSQPPLFEYASTGLESASEQDSCSSSSEALTNYSLKTSTPPPLSAQKNKTTPYWNQATLIKLAFEVPGEQNFAHLDQLLQTSAHYELSLSKRIELTNLEMIGMQALKVEALAQLSDEISSRLHPPTSKLGGLKIISGPATPTPKNHSWGSWLPLSRFSPKPKSEQAEGIPFWSLAEMQKISKEIALTDKIALMQLSKTTQEYVSQLWPQQATFIRQLEKEQYRIANLTLLCSLKFTIMEQMKNIVQSERTATF